MSQVEGGGSTGAVRSRGCRCHWEPLEQAHRWRGNRFSRITRCDPGRGTGLEDNHCLWGGLMSPPSPTASPECEGDGCGGRGGRACPSGASDEQRRAAAGEAARKGGLVRARLAPPGARGRRAHGAQSAGAGAGAGVGGALPARAAPSSPPSAPAPRPDPSSRVPHLHAAGGSRVCACGGRPGRRVGRGGGEGARPLTARTRATAPPHGAAPEAPPTPPPGRTRARGEQRVALGPQGRSRPRPPSPRPRWPRAGSNPPTHDNQVEMLPSHTAPSRGPSETQVPRG